MDDDERCSDPEPGAVEEKKGCSHRVVLKRSPKGVLYIIGIRGDQVIEGLPVAFKKQIRGIPGTGWNLDETKNLFRLCLAAG